MSSTIAPNTFTTSDVIAAQGLLISNLARGQIDLRGKVGAYLKVDIARISATAYTNPVDVVINRLHGTITGSAPTATSDRRSVSNFLGFQSTLTGGGTVTAQLNANTAVGDTTVVIKSSNTGFTVYGTKFAILGSTAPGSITNTQSLTGFEVAEMVATSGSGPWTLTTRGRLGVAHSTNDYATSAVDCREVWLPGGFIYEVVIDADNISAGAGCVVRAEAQIYPNDQVTTP